MQKLLDLLKSRKFWAAVIGLIVIVLRNLWPTFPLSDQQINDIALLLVAFIVGTGLEDVGAGYVKSAYLEHEARNIAAMVPLKK